MVMWLECFAALRCRAPQNARSKARYEYHQFCPDGPLV